MVLSRRGDGEAVNTFLLNRAFLFPGRSLSDPDLNCAGVWYKTSWIKVGALIDEMDLLTTLSANTDHWICNNTKLG